MASYPSIEFPNNVIPEVFNKNSFVSKALKSDILSAKNSPIPGIFRSLVFFSDIFRGTFPRSMNFSSIKGSVGNHNDILVSTYFPRLYLSIFD